MAREENQVDIVIKGIPESITPTISPTPNYYLNRLPYFSTVTNYWYASIWSGSSDITYTISATGYIPGEVLVPANYTGELEVTLTEDSKPEHLYGWTDPNASSETLYAWTIESGASINNGEITTVYTKTPNPALDTSTGNFTELFDKDGNSYGKDRSDLMSWTLTNTSGKTMGETYVNSMSSSIITLTAIGPA